MKKDEEDELYKATAKDVAMTENKFLWVIELKLLRFIYHLRKREI